MHTYKAGDNGSPRVYFFSSPCPPWRALDSQVLSQALSINVMHTDVPLDSAGPTSRTESWCYLSAQVIIQGEMFRGVSQKVKLCPSVFHSVPPRARNGVRFVLSQGRRKVESTAHLCFWLLEMLQQL